MNELPIYHGPCPYCGSAISVVIQDGTTVARCSHRGCGARGPIMRSTERAVELFRAGRFASQAQAAQSVLDATARAEAAERELAAEREAHELEKRAHEHTWQQKVRQIERAEAAEKRDATRIEGIMAQIADLERDRDHWRTVAESRPDISPEEAEKQARLGWERAAEKDRAYGDMIRDRDHWRTVAESRPDISPEDAARYIAWRSGFAPHPRNFDRLQPIDDAMREHGCEIAYQREPTQEEGDAHEYCHDQSMGASHGSGECFVPMGSHHGWKCKCGTWVWGGPTVCQRCVDADAVKIALEWKAEADRLRKLFDDAGEGQYNVLNLVESYQRSSMDAEERLRAVRKLLEENGCECPCDHHWEERGPECEVCLACLVGEAVGKMSHKDGRVVLSAWVDPVLRDYAREAARLSGLEFSRWVERAVRQTMARESADRAMVAASERGECGTCGYAPCACDQQ